MTLSYDRLVIPFQNVMAHTERITLSLDAELVAFLDDRTDNRSRVVSELLREWKREITKREWETACIEEANDPEAAAEFELWDATVGDGLDA